MTPMNRDPLPLDQVPIKYLMAPHVDQLIDLLRAEWNREHGDPGAMANRGATWALESDRMWSRGLDRDLPLAKLWRVVAVTGSWREVHALMIGVNVGQQLLLNTVKPFRAEYEVRIVSALAGYPEVVEVLCAAMGWSMPVRPEDAPEPVSIRNGG